MSGCGCGVERSRLWPLSLFALARDGGREGFNHGWALIITDGRRGAARRGGRVVCGAYREVGPAEGGWELRVAKRLSWRLSRLMTGCGACGRGRSRRNFNRRLHRRAQMTEGFSATWMTTRGAGGWSSSNSRLGPRKWLRRQGVGGLELFERLAKRACLAIGRFLVIRARCSRSGRACRSH